MGMHVCMHIFMRMIMRTCIRMLMRMYMCMRMLMCMDVLMGEQDEGWCIKSWPSMQLEGRERTGWWPACPRN